MSYELIAFDMDGTLLNSSKEISEENLKAIREAYNAGKTIALSTGRSMPELRQFAEQLEYVRYYICISGAILYDKQEDKIIYQNNIAPEVAARLFDLIEGKDIMVHIHSFESVVERKMLDRMADFQIPEYTEMFRKVTSPVEHITDFFHAHPDAMSKINLYHKNTAERAVTEQMLIEKNLPLELAYSERTSLECSAKGVSKATGLQILCQHLNLDISQTIAVGDADNDLAILKAAGLPIAMANANENVKAVCKAQVSDNNHHGCAEAVYKYLLGKTE